MAAMKLLEQLHRTRVLAKEEMTELLVQLGVGDRDRERSGRAAGGRHGTNGSWTAGDQGGANGARIADELVASDGSLITGALTADQAALRQRLFDLAVDVRRRMYGNRVFMRGLVEFSNYCRQDCRYCGIRRSNRKAERYRLDMDDIERCCEEGYRLGYRTFVLQSGEDPYYTDSKMVRLVRLLKKRWPDAAVTLSLGERSEASYRALREAGADRYLLRHETASRRLYDPLHPGMSLDSRIRCLQALKRIGYQVGAGFMVGLPGQTAEDLAEDLLFLAELQPEMVGIGPFIPHKDTPLAGASGGTVEQTRVMVALTRLILPASLLPATTAMGTLHPQGRELALQAGANVVMPNLSPIAVREKYALYDNKICTGDESAQCRHCLELRLAAAGFEPDMGRGDPVFMVQRPGAEVSFCEFSRDSFANHVNNFTIIE